MHIFFNRGQRTTKFGMVSQANRQVKNKNMTEILKKVVYQPDNYMLRAYEEQTLMEKTHEYLMAKVEGSCWDQFDIIE